MADVKDEVEHKSDDDLVDIKDKKKGKKGKKDKEETEIEEDFSTEVTSRLTRILKDPDICDVTFIVGKEKEEIHSVRAHLACQSDYFRAMFFGKMQESLEDHPKITLPEFSPRPFKVFLSFIHTGRIKFNSKEEGLISDLLKLADHFDVPHLFSACYRITEKKIDENNVLELLLVAERYNDKKLFEHALSFIMKHAETLFGKPEFVNSLTAHNFIEFLSKDELAATEITLFQSVLIWGKHKKETGDAKADFTEIVKEPMSKIRFALIPAKKLMEVVRPTGFIDKKTLMNILAYQADKKHFTAEKLGLNIQRRFRVLYGSGAVSPEAVSRKTTFSPGPAAGYHNTHDGGLAVLAGKLWAHYGNDGAQGNRVWVVDIESAERSQINLPWGTHGSYPATDFQKYVYLYEDSDSAHGNGFGRIDIETSEFEALAPVPGAHCRYSSGCVQGGYFWKLASGTMLHAYSIEENKWESKGVTLSSQSIVLADPTDEDFIWFMVQGGSLRKYSISGNSFDDKASRPSGFSLGANYSAIIMPRVDDESGEVGGIIICAFQSGNGWQFYDSGKNTWAPLSWPDIMEGGHTAYDFGSQTVYLQVNNQSTFQKVCYGED